MIDQDFLSDLQYALLEPPDGGQSWPSEVWTREDVLTQVDAGCRRVVRESQAITVYLEQFLPPNSLSVTMPSDWLATASLVWRIFPSEVRTLLLATDAFEADHALPGWEVNLATPIAYADLDTNTREIRLVPTPDVAGTLENLYVPVPALVTGNGTPMPVPEELLSAVKYDTIGTLLSGVTRLGDPERAAYCEERVELAIDAVELLLKGGA